MPRKSKDEELNKVTIEPAEKVSAKTKKTTAKNKKQTAKAKKVDVENKKVTTRTKKTAVENEKQAVKKTNSKEVKAGSKKVAKTTAKEEASKTANNKSTTKVRKNSTKKATEPVSKSTAKATKKISKQSDSKEDLSSNKKLTKVVKKSVVPVEYYDLPTYYDKTVVKILAQTPSCLFVYWEVSKSDRLKLQKQYGEYFFNDTKPYLVVINETMNYSFEVEINDYANSWYISINDSSCKYIVKLIRKPINNQIPISPVVDIISSNEESSPNDHILFDKLGKTVFFRNTKTNVTIEKDISSISLMSNVGKIYNIYDFYKEIYKNELNGDELGMSLSSSQFSSTYR